VNDDSRGNTQNSNMNTSPVDLLDLFFRDKPSDYTNKQPVDGASDDNSHKVSNELSDHYNASNISGVVKDNCGLYPAFREDQVLIVKTEIRHHTCTKCTRPTSTRNPNSIPANSVFVTVVDGVVSDVLSYETFW
jgi:hypothetical protein